MFIESVQFGESPCVIEATLQKDARKATEIIDKNIANLIKN